MARKVKILSGYEGLACVFFHIARDEAGEKAGFGRVGGSFFVWRRPIAIFGAHVLECLPLEKSSLPCQTKKPIIPTDDEARLAAFVPPAAGKLPGSTAQKSAA